MMSQPPSKQGSGRRSRIVIDVAQAQADARFGRQRKSFSFGRGAKILSAGALIAVALAVALLVGGYAWWQHYKKSPAYSLALLVDAAQHDDTRAVEGLIDSDRITQGFAPQVIEKLTSGTLPVTLARSQVEAALPQMLPRVRETMREEITRAAKNFSEKSGGSTPFILFALGISRASEIREQGDAATVALKAADRPVELAMQRNGERWKVVTVKDDALASDIATRVASSLPAPGSIPPPSAPRRKRGR
ncbi:MAG: hypothetical protein LC754_05735 [Acidobacteria bacterium]|nr:hypothetical protein [Acidobacteriota bacterium]